MYAWGFVQLTLEFGVPLLCLSSEPIGRTPQRSNVEQIQTRGAQRITNARKQTISESKTATFLTSQDPPHPLLHASSCVPNTGKKILLAPSAKA
ncbi:hypothetical protein EV426DRAFT_624874 [Tirmania nivea]|nr:hypothetical protein EV426DRAFT_624874 [Tirmania nivea]